MCLLSARIKKIQLRMNSLERQQHFSHYKSMGIFQFAQRQPTPEPLARTAPNRTFQTLWLSWIPERMKKIRSKMKTLEWPQDNMLIFLRSRADNSEVSSRIWQKFELIQVLMHVLVTCKNDEDPMKNEFAGVTTTFLP